jgi:alkanesulfonate monooxygenase SsuD/methylene tetrahydromethanopterin reductase-like flavin-dependent oxidoreductase (luciferase family)
VGRVHAELEQAGRDPAAFRFVHYSILLPGASRADALARYGDAVWALNWKYSDMEASATRPLPPASPPPFDGSDDSLLARRTAHAGTPAELVEALLAIRNGVPVPVEFVARSHLPMLEYDAQVEIMQQLAQDVAPHV